MAYKRKAPRSGGRAIKFQRTSAFPSLALVRSGGGRITYKNVPNTIPRAFPVRYGGYRTPASRMERKFVDLNDAVYELSTSGVTTLIPVIPQGAGESQRIGREVQLASVQIHGYCSAKTTTVTSRGRIMLVWDKQPNAALAAVTDILTANSSQALLNDQNKKRFRVLLNEFFVFSGNITTPSTGMEIYPFQRFVKLRKRMITYGTVGTGVIGDIKTGALLLLTTGDIATGTGSAQLQATFRVRFYDP